MTDLLYDPWFYAAAVPAVALVGLSKGGLGGATALIGVPLMALVLPPVQAAAVMLPILVVMDMFALWSWRGYRDMETLKHLLPGGMLGITIGWLTAAFVTAAMIKLIVGVIALVFAARWYLDRARGRRQVRAHSMVRGTFWGTGAGFTSFVAHAGGPPYQIYALPFDHDPKIYTGTSTIFFAIVNAVKLVPYFALGQFDATNLAASAILLPIAPIAILAGVMIVRRMNREVFYPFMYAMIVLVGLKLTWDGAVVFLL
ncbi:MAG: sulfite exporter TauE/SafE family protein [Rhizobiaceae bacterium]